MKKRIFSILISLCMVMALVPATVFAIGGDLNWDGQVDNRDANSLISYLDGKKELDDNQLADADVNADGEVDSDDLFEIIGHIYPDESYYFDVEVTDGKATVAGVKITEMVPGITVTVTADDPPEGKVFDEWNVDEGAISLDDKDSETTSFVMPGESVRIKAGFVPADTLTVPFTTTVALGDTGKPGETLFDMQVVNSEGDVLQYDGVTITAKPVVTNGAGNYEGEITFTGKGHKILSMFDEEKFIYVKQADGKYPNWRIDDTVWGIYYKIIAELADNGENSSPVSFYQATIVLSDDGTNYHYEIAEDADAKELMTFVNTYTKSAADPSNPDGTTNGDSNNADKTADTGDDANLTLWIALILLSVAGIGGTAIYTRRKRANE